MHLPDSNHNLALGTNPLEVAGPQRRSAFART